MAKSIADYQKDWQDATARGDTAAANAAHAAAEAIRAGSGYSGGADGSQHIALPSSSGSYTPTGAGSDYWAGVNNVSDAHNDMLHRYQDQYNAAKARGDSDGMDAAHAAAEALRAQYGYSGGKDGSEGSLGLNLRPSGTGGWSGGQAPSYTEKYQGKIDDLMDAILKRDPFSYNYLEDPLYQQYRDAYTREGERAMLNTMGQAAARTGGYLSTAGQVAAQQANNYYTAKIGDKIPELEQLAYQMWLDDYDMDVKNLGLLQGLEDFNYDKYLTTLGQFNTDRNFNYGAYRDQVDDARYDSKEQYDRALSRAQLLAAAGDFSGYGALGYSDSDIALLQTAAQMSQSGGGTGGRVSGGTGGGSEDYEGLMRAAKNSANPRNYIASHYKEYGFTSSTGLWDGYQEYEFESPEIVDDGDYGPQFRDVYRSAAEMKNSGKSTKEIVSYLERFGDDKITDTGRMIILRYLGYE